MVGFGSRWGRPPPQAAISCWFPALYRLSASFSQAFRIVPTSLIGGCIAQTYTDRAAWRAPARRPWRPAHGTARPCRTSRPRPRTPRPPPGRRRSRRFRPSCRAPKTGSCWAAAAASAPKMTAFGVSGLDARLEPVAQRRHPGGLFGQPCRAASAAAPNPAMPATFSVPARAPRSWPPPLISGSSGRPSRRISAPTPLRAADLVRRQRHQIGAERLEIAGDAARALDRVDMQEPAGRMHQRGCLRDRLDHAGLVVGEHQRNQRPRPAARAAAPAPRDRRRPRRSPAMSSAAANRPPLRTEGCSIAETSSVCAERRRRAPACWPRCRPR